MNNCNCRTTVSASQCFYGIAGWCSAMSVLFITLDVTIINPNNYLDIHGNKAILARLLFVAVSAFAVIIQITAKQKIMMMYPFFANTDIWRRLFWLVVLLILPVLEIVTLTKLGLKRVEAIPNFWCNQIGCATSIRATKLAEGIREKYFAQVDDDDSPDILISTNTGMLVSMLIRDSSIYLCVLVGEDGDLPMNTIILPPDSKWRLETSEDGCSGALVSEYFFCPCNATESALAKSVITILDELPMCIEGEK